MIRGYRRMPMFDDGMDFAQDKMNYIQSLQNQTPMIDQYDQMAALNNVMQQARAQREEEQFNQMMSEDSDVANNVLDEMYNRIQRSIKQPTVAPRRTPIKRSNPARKVVTTAEQDRKAAEKRYSADMKAVEKKSKAEVANAKKQVAQANVVLKRNNASTYSLGNITRGYHQLPELVVTGHRNNKKNNNTNPNNSSNRVVNSAGVGSYRSSVSSQSETYKKKLAQAIAKKKQQKKDYVQKGTSRTNRNNRAFWGSWW